MAHFQMKISIITVSFNAAKTISRTLQSIADQTYADIEHIVVDGKSTDDTMEIVQTYPHIAHCISGQDKGMYDAINKGIKLATGEYVGILNSDDWLNNELVIENLVQEIKKDQKDVYFGDIRFVKSRNSDKTLRYYSSAKFHPSRFANGYMPAHPSCYIKRSLFNELGGYKTDYHIAADYELLIRYLHTGGLSYRYLPMLMVDMLSGGRSNSSLQSRYILNKEIVRGCRENGISTNMIKLSLKYFKKVFEYLPSSK